MSKRVPDRRIEARCDNLDCEQPETGEYTPSEFEDWLAEGDFGCSNCGHEFTIENLNVACALCSDGVDYLDLNNLVNDVLCNRCPGCAVRWGVDGGQTVFIQGSWSEAYFIYEWTQSGKRKDVLEHL